MNISIFSYYLLFLYEKDFFKTPYDAFFHAKKCGITHAEAFTFEFPKYPLSAYKKYLQEADITLQTIITTTSFAVCGKENYNCELSRIKKLCHDAKNAGAEFLMIVPDAESSNFPQTKTQIRDNIIEGMNEIVNAGKAEGITVTMENFSLNSYPYSTIDEMEYILKNVDGLKYTIDSGNFHCVKNDILKAYERLKSYVVNVHVKDWHEDADGLISRPGLPTLDGCTFGEGLLPLKELLSELKKDNYGGSLVIELNSEKITPESISLSAEFLRRNYNA